jgi:hypothetical protein
MDVVCISMWLLVCVLLLLTPCCLVHSAMRRPWDCVCLRVLLLVLLGLLLLLLPSLLLCRLLLPCRLLCLPCSLVMVPEVLLLWQLHVCVEGCFWPCMGLVCWQGLLLSSAGRDTAILACPQLLDQPASQTQCA